MSGRMRESTYLKLRLELPIARVSWGHSHRGVLGWRWCRSVRGASGSRVILRTAPRETDTGVANGIALHLVDGHFSSMTLDELNETAALSGWDLNVGDLAEALEEGTEFILSDVAGETANEDSGIVGIGELVHGLRSTVVA